MNPQELQNQIDDLKKDIQNLKRINEQNLLNINQSPIKIDRAIDEDSKKIIEEIIRRFYLKTAETMAATFIITPKSQYHRLTAAAAVTSNTTTAIVDGYFVGQLLIIEGTDNTNTITIKDNANTKMAGDVVLGINDTITFMWDDTDWIELARSNN